MKVKLPLTATAAASLAEKPMVGKLVQPVSSSSLEESMPTEALPSIDGPLDFIKSLPDKALEKLAEGLDIDVSLMTGIATPIEPIVKSILEYVASCRDKMSQKNIDWDDAMNLQMKMDIWSAWRKLFEKAGLLDPLPDNWMSRARGD